MPVRYDPLIVRALAREILDAWGGVRVRSIGLDPVRAAGAVRFEDGSSLLATLHADAGHVLRWDGALVGPTVRETLLHRLELTDAAATPDERAIILSFGDGGGPPTAGVALELQTHRWNVLVLQAPGDAEVAVGVDWRTRYALHTREVDGRALRPGVPYSPPRSTRDGIESAASLEAWAGTLAAAGADRRGSVLRRWAWTSTLNVDWVLGDASGADPAASYARYVRLTRTDEDGGAWLLDRRWGAQPYPLALESPGPPAARRLLDAMDAAMELAGGVEGSLTAAETADPEGSDGSGSATDAARLRDVLTRRRERVRRRLAALERQLEQASDPEGTRELGQLLLARKADVPRGTTRVTLAAFDGTTRAVDLDPRLDAVANAARYFDEARRRERARERLPREIAAAGVRLDEIETAIARLDREGASADMPELVGGSAGAADARGPDPGIGGRRQRADRTARGRPVEGDPLPYRRLMSSGGLEIRVGRGARDNDDLTFRHSAPDDIWLHAQQAAGAHVILRWGRKDENPPRRDLLEAAMAAAVYSGARHSGAVNVVWTRRKHVRKPRKAPPGTVVPDRVKTVFVEPDEALVRSLRLED